MERVFYSLLERVGTEGKYQFNNQIIHCLYLTIAGATTFFNAFLFYEQPYQCPQLTSTQCLTYVCALPETSRQPFINPAFSSFVTKFGDHRCSSSQLDSMQSLIYLGGIIGVIMGAYLSEVMTKRSILISCVVANILGIVLAILGPTLLIASMGLFINFGAKCIELQIAICYMTESIGQSIRPKYIMMCYIVFGFAGTINGLIFKYIRWEIALSAYIILPLSFALLGLTYYTRQTPFDLITNYSPQDSLQMLRDIAKKNGMQSDLTLAQIANIKDEYDENEKSKQHFQVSFLDLFKYESLRTIVIMSILLHFITSFQFNAPELALKNYELDVYLNGIIIGFSQLVACLFNYFTIDDMMRKKGLLISQCLAFVVAVVTLIVGQCPDSQCSNTQKILQSLGLFTFRFITTIAYNLFYMIQYEIFPNQVRGLALQTTAIASYTSVFLIPLIMTFCQRTGISIIIFYAASCIFAFLFTLKLKETYGVPPPEVIEQLQYEHHALHQKIRHIQ